jgi:CRISPR/Cas system-associated exonuclease Cas4 (RecB family)
MPKTQRVIQALEDKSARGFSPSALNLYIRCPLQFYFQEVMGISESEEIEETIESKTLGTVIHDVLYRMYQPFTGKFVEPGKLLEQLKNTEEYLDAAFREHYRDGDLEHGKNHLAYKVSQFLVNQLIRSEAERLGKEARPGDTLFILALEEKLESIVVCRSGESMVNVRVKGKADRIDRWGQATRVIDYKTGSVKAEDLRVKLWDTLATDPKMAKAFQLLVYAYLHEKQNPVDDGFLHSGNISLRKISEDVMEVKLPGDQPVTKESLEIFEKIMIGVLEEILDPGVAFNQTDDLEICSYCPFKAICCR